MISKKFVRISKSHAKNILVVCFICLIYFLYISSHDGDGDTHRSLIAASMLDLKDQIFRIRNFSSMPISIGSAHPNEMDKCSVPCVSYPLVDSAGTELGHDFELGKNVLRSMESPVYYPNLKYSRAKSDHGYNLNNNNNYKVVMTTALDSDVPAGYFSWAEYNFMEQPEPKSADYDAIAVISNCNAKSFRIQAIRAIEKLGIRVGKFGQCFRQRLIGDKIQQIKRYKFVLAFENSIYQDYVTEKFFQTLVAGSVPVVIGAPNIMDFQPQQNTILHIKSMDDIPQIVQHMKYLLENDDEYQKMLSWKSVGPSDKFLALVDMAVVHSTCRLCIHAADRYWLELENKLEICKNSKCSVIFVRERGSFYFDAISTNIDAELSDQDAESMAEQLVENVKSHFTSRNHRPQWVGKRPDFKKSQNLLQIYRIYPAFETTQREALYENHEVLPTKYIRDLIRKPCSFFEVIFI